jgi:pimeloyl-ACP methyl ester carboxylesterase
MVVTQSRRERAMERIEYDEFGLFHENAEEFGLPYDGPPTVRREFVGLPDGRRVSALVWGTGDPEYVLLHGGAQNAHTWDTVAMAMDRPLVAIDLPGHGHSDGPNGSGGGQLAPMSLAEDVAFAIRKVAPNARGVIGMSLGGLTTIALTAVAPDLVRAVVLVDVTPGVNAEKSKVISDFINGPESFDSFDDLLARTIQYNPTRTESSLRRGILHNAVQRDDGSWVWRYMRFRAAPAPAAEGAEGAPGAEGGEAAVPANEAAFERFQQLWDAVARITVPLLLARGMREQSVVTDEDEVKLLEVLPSAKVEHFDDAGHSLQGDMPVELARSILAFVP